MFIKNKSQVYLRLSDETVQMTDFIKSWPLSTCFVVFCVTEWEACKQSLARPQVGDLLQGKVLMQLFELYTEL